MESWGGEDDEALANTSPTEENRSSNESIHLNAKKKVLDKKKNRRFF